MPVVYGKTNSSGETQSTPKKAKGVTGKDSKPMPLLKKVLKEIEDIKGNTETWSTKQEKWHKMRMRIKKSKTFPFANSSNIRMPTLELNIRKAKAAIMNVLFGIRPVAQVLPSPGTSREAALKIEKFLDHLVLDVMDIHPKVEIAVDQSLEKGFFLLKPHWRVEITKRQEEVDLKKLSPDEVLALFEAPRELLLQEVVQRLQVDLNDKVAQDNLKAIDDAIDELQTGKSKVEVMVKDVTYDFPDVALVSPERCYVSTDSGFDPQKAQGISHEFFLPLGQLKANAEEKGWSKKAVEGIGATRGTDVDKLSDFQKDIREGISRLNKTDLVKIVEWYGWYDINNDGIPEKCVITLAPEFKRELRKTTLSNLSGKFPFVKFFYELTDDRWYSHRGIPELIEDIVKEIDVQHNMKIDSQTIRNAPMFIYRAGMVDPNLVQMIPNQGIAVNGLQPLDDTLKAINLHNPNTEFSYEREQQILETKVSEMVGQVDFSLQSQINKRQPRTLGEVQEQVSSAGKTFSLDAKHYTNQFGELLNFVFELWSEFGQDEYEFNYFGDTIQGERIKLTKEEIQGKYTIVVRGNDQNTNPQVRLQKAQQLLLAAKDPMLLQLGITDPQKIANSLKRFYQEMDIDNVEEYINTQPQPQQPPDPALSIEPKFEDLEDGEQAQVLMKRGIQPDQGKRLANTRQDTLLNAAEIASKIGEEGGF